MPNKTFLRRPLRHIAVMGWSCWAWIVLAWRYSTSHLSCIALSQLQYSAQYIYIIYTMFSLYITLTLTSPYITSIAYITCIITCLWLQLPPAEPQLRYVAACAKEAVRYDLIVIDVFDGQGANNRPKPRVFVAVTPSVNNGYGMVSKVMDAQTYTSTLYP